MKPKITRERLQELLHYDSGTGEFTWAQARGVFKAGDKCPRMTKNGYKRVSLDGHCYLQHRLAWLWVYGYFPVGQIDHINGIRTDNRIANLRDVSAFENQQNLKSAQRNNRSCGLLGVTYTRVCPSRPWKASIRANGKNHFLGHFNTPEDAHAAYLSAKRRLHPGTTI